MSTMPGAHSRASGFPSGGGKGGGCRLGKRMTDTETKAFYESRLWRKLRREVLAADKYECLHCKAKGKYTHANHCHHVNYLKLHPELALEKFYKDDEGNVKRQLISLCHNHHEEIHQWVRKEAPAPLTQERW